MDCSVELTVESGWVFESQEQYLTWNWLNKMEPPSRIRRARGSEVFIVKSIVVDLAEGWAWSGWYEGDNRLTTQTSNFYLAIPGHDAKITPRWVEVGKNNCPPVNSVGFKSDYIRFLSGSWCNEEGVSVTTIRGVEELQEYIWRYLKTPVGYRCEQAREYSAFLRQTYTQQFFLTHHLVLIGVQETSGSIRHSVSGVCASGVVFVDRLIPKVETDDIAYWSIVVEVSSIVFPNPSCDYTVEFNEVSLRHFDSYNFRLSNNSINDGGHIVITSVAQLEAYLSGYFLDTKLSTTNSFNNYAQFLKETFDNQFFNWHQLVIAGFTEGSGGNRNKVTNVTDCGIITLERYQLGENTDIGYWSIVIVISNDISPQNGFRIIRTGLGFNQQPTDLQHWLAVLLNALENEGFLIENAPPFDTGMFGYNALREVDGELLNIVVNVGCFFPIIPSEWYFGGIEIDHESLNAQFVFGNIFVFGTLEAVTIAYISLGGALHFPVAKYYEVPFVIGEHLPIAFDSWQRSYLQITSLSQLNSLIMDGHSHNYTADFFKDNVLIVARHDIPYAAWAEHIWLDTIVKSDNSLYFVFMENIPRERVWGAVWGGWRQYTFEISREIFDKYEIGGIRFGNAMGYPPRTLRGTAFFGVIVRLENILAASTDTLLVALIAAGFVIEPRPTFSTEIILRATRDDGEYIWISIQMMVQSIIVQPPFVWRLEPIQGSGVYTTRPGYRFGRITFNGTSEAVQIAYNAFNPVMA
ncbi:MAG: hypothetical protein FWD86_01720 [Firmicutes bacterium]|nr:hypothetical protein [Bacillota bacterium]